MDSFFTSTGSSPPEERPEDAAAGHDPRRPEEHEGAGPLPEELIEALAGLLAEALVNDVRQYPDFRELTLSSSSFPDPAGAQLTAPPKNGHLHQQPAGHRRTSTRSRTRRPAHAS